MHQVGLHSTAFFVGSTAKTSRPRNTTCICSGFRAKQPKPCAALLAALANGSEAARATFPFAFGTSLCADYIPRAVLQSDWSATIVAEDTGR